MALAFAKRTARLDSGPHGRRRPGPSAPSSGRPDDPRRGVSFIYLPQAGRAVTLALVAFLILGCRGGATPGPQLTANMVGDPAAEGSISAYPRSDGRAELSGFLGSGGDWGATIRSGTCEEPGPIEHIVGPVENGTIYAVVDEPFSALAGKIIVMTPLGSNRQASCGVLGGS